MDRYTIDTHSMTEFLTELLNTPSPTGFHEQAIALCERTFSALPVAMTRNNKGALILNWAGADSSMPRGLTAHLDTLGAIVDHINGNGRLRLSMLGSWAWGSVEGEGVTVHLEDGRTLRGTIMPVKASVHIYGQEARTFIREAGAYEVRLDERTTSAEQTRKLGVGVGDYVSFDPRVEIGASGFIRSRHLDDKASVACIYAAVRALADAGLQPAQRTTILLSNYEEVGHGAAAGLPADLTELLTIDIGIAGGMQNTDEFTVSICAKDGGGPYHIDMRRKLVRLAEAARIPYQIDIYPFYGSDGEAFWNAGGDARVGLIGPGVDATHHYERAHIDSLVATAQLIAEYLLAD